MKGKYQRVSPKRIHPAVPAGAAVLLVLLILLLCRCCGIPEVTPTLAVQTPQKLSASQRDAFTVDVTISDLDDIRYPAMSMSIRFDPSCLEFLGIEEGNVFVTDSTTGRKLPQWSCDSRQCNETGLINVMYLDLTGGKEAFTGELLEKENNVVLRLKLRLRGSARSGDVYDLILEDAVFAASEESSSLAMVHKTLNTKNAKIVVGD